MAEKKKSTRGSHAKPAEEKKKTHLPRNSRSKNNDEPTVEESMASFSEELYEKPYHPQDEQSDAATDVTPTEDTAETVPSAKMIRSEKRRAAQEEKAAAREAEREAREARKADNSPQAKDRRRKSRIAIIVVCVVAALIFAGATYAGYAITKSPLTLPNVYIGDIFVGSMDADEIENALDEGKWRSVTRQKLTVQLPANIEIVFKYADSGAVLTVDEAFDAAERFGHDGSWYSNLVRYVYNVFSATDLVEFYRVMDNNYINTTVQKGLDEFYAATAESGYVIEEEKSMMYMIKGGGYLRFNEEALNAAINQALIAGQQELVYDSFDSLPAMPDFAAIHKELEREPVDASYTETFEVIDDVVGCKFDVTQAETIWKNAKYGDSLEIPMDITFPAVTSEELEGRLYRDILGEQTTYYPNSSDNRINNLNQAVKKISGIILLPGESFSYNETVGQRTEASGFLPAGAYDDGEVVEQIGGGVCQVSSTLYSATLYAQMETLDRTCHFFAVDYLDKGMDATVSWPKPDFKFKNCRDYPIKIIAYCDNEARSLTVAIMGTDVDGSYVNIRRDTYTKYGEYGEAIGYSVLQYRDIYAADGTYLRTESYDYLDDYYFHDYKEITAQAKAAAEAAAGAAEGGIPPDT